MVEKKIESNPLDQKVFQQLMELFITPEVKLRQTEGILEKPVNLRSAQIIFYPDGRKNEIRINSEVKAIALAKVTGPVNKGDPVYYNQIEEFTEVELTDEDDPNCGHATLLKLSNNWFVFFDFRYNKKLASKHSKTPKEFLAGANFAKSQKHWSLFIDSLCSASELAAKSILLTQPDPSLRDKGNHKLIHRKINKHAHLGNIPKEHTMAYNKIWKLRSKARYLKGEYNIKGEEDESLWNTVNNLIELSVLRVGKDK